MARLLSLTALILLAVLAQTRYLSMNSRTYLRSGSRGNQGARQALRGAARDYLGRSDRRSSGQRRSSSQSRQSYRSKRDSMLRLSSRQQRPQGADRQMERCIEGQMDKLIDGQINTQIDRFIDRQIFRQIARWLDGLIDQLVG